MFNRLIDRLNGHVGIIFHRVSNRLTKYFGHAIRRLSGRSVITLLSFGNRAVI